MSWIINLLVTALAVWAGAALLSGVTIKSFKTAIWVALLFAIINATLGAILRFLSTPLNWLTLGLLHFIITVLMIMLVDKLVSNFQIKNFWWAVALAIIVSIASSLVGKLMGV